jgi:hypothetical protein
MANDTNTPEQAERVYNLTKDLVTIQRNKKDAVAGYNEEIKRLKKEIDDVLKESEGEADREV